MTTLLAGIGIGLTIGVAATVLFIARTSHLIVARLRPEERLAWARKVTAATRR